VAKLRRGTSAAFTIAQWRRDLSLAGAAQAFGDFASN
jgi:hypothetical protein